MGNTLWLIAIMLVCLLVVGVLLHLTGLLLRLGLVIAVVIVLYKFATRKK